MTQSNYDTWVYFQENPDERIETAPRSNGNKDLLAEMERIQKETEMWRGDSERMKNRETMLRMAETK